MPTIRILVASALFTLLPLIAAADTVGAHRGEKRPIEYHIEYRNALGVTTANATGITFAPYGYIPYVEETILPPRYFGDYPLYFSGGTFAFTVHITNTGKRTYRNLMIEATQEFLNTEGAAGVPFPGAPTRWVVEVLSPGETVSLVGEMTLPALSSSGIDQTHLRVIHWDAGEPDLGVAQGRVIIDDPQAGLWCPL